MVRYSRSLPCSWDGRDTEGIPNFADPDETLICNTEEMVNNVDCSAKCYLITLSVAKNVCTAPVVDE